MATNIHYINFFLSARTWVRCISNQKEVMLKCLLLYSCPLLGLDCIHDGLKLTFLGISYLLFARNNCGKKFFKEFQGLLITKTFVTWKIKISEKWFLWNFNSKENESTYISFHKNILQLHNITLMQSKFAKPEFIQCFKCCMIIRG